MNKKNDSADRGKTDCASINKASQTASVSAVQTQPKTPAGRAADFDKEFRARMRKSETLQRALGMCVP